MGKTAPPVMSLRGAQRRSNLLVLVDTEGDGEIAAASLGWPRNDMGKRAPPVMSLRGVQRRSNLRVIVGMNGDGEIAAASLGWPRNDMETALAMT